MLSVLPRSKPRPPCYLVLFAAVLLSSSACGDDGLDQAEIRAVCMSVGAGGWREALSVAKQAGISDDAAARAAVRQVVPDNCPAYVHGLEGLP